MISKFPRFAVVCMLMFTLCMLGCASTPGTQPTQHLTNVIYTTPNDAQALSLDGDLPMLDPDQFQKLQTQQLMPADDICGPVKIVSMQNLNKPYNRIPRLQYVAGSQPKLKNSGKRYITYRVSVRSLRPSGRCHCK